MAITNKLITFNKLTSFETQLAQGNILETSIVFIKDAKKIWTKGTYFDCSGGGSSIPIIELPTGLSGTLDESQLTVLNNEPNMFIALLRVSHNSLAYVLFTRNVIVGSGMFSYLAINGSYKYTFEKNGETYTITQTELALKSDIPNTDDFATKDDIGYTTEFSVADIEAVYGRGVTKPVNVQGLISAIEANKPIIIPTNITDASQVGGNAVTMAKMENDGFIYLNVIVPYLDGVHKEYFIQIKITTAQLIKSGSNGSITLKELVARETLEEVEEVWATTYNKLNTKISEVQQYIYDEAASRKQFDEAIAEIQSIIAENESVVTAAWNQLNTRINALEAAQIS